MKTICFTNNDLAKAMGLEENDEIVIRNDKTFNGTYKVVKKDGVLMLYTLICGKENWFFMFLLIDKEWHKIEPKPQLTEQEITILKGRQAEGWQYVCKKMSDELRYTSDSWAGYQSVTWARKHAPFKSLKVDEEYSIEELLKGVE